MNIVIRDRDFLFSLEVISYLMDIACIWLLKEPLSILVIVVVILRIFEILEKLVFLLICSYECLSGKGATNWSRSLLVCLNVLAFQFPGAKESDRVMALNVWMLVYECNISDSLVPLVFPECGFCMDVYLSALLHSFQE